MYNDRIRKIALVLVLGSASAVLRGQNQAVGPLTTDHPIVIEHLIGLHDGLSSHIAVRNAEDPANTESHQSGAMRIFGVSAEGYNRLATILSAAKVRWDAVRSSQSRYAARLTKGEAPATQKGAIPAGFYKSRGYASDVINGKLAISKVHAKQLAAFFRVSADLFI